jgi:nucleotide-binding universal stress UspA family protein
MMTTENKNILFATDMSNDCRDAYAYALNLATKCDGRITLLHVIESQPTSLENRIKNLFGEDRYEEIMREHESDARSILIGKRKESDLVKTALSKLTDDFSGRRPEGSLQEDKILVKKGDVVEEIITTANEEECDLIILSSHASSPNESFVSKKMQDVIRLSKAPVTVVPPSGIGIVEL